MEEKWYRQLLKKIISSSEVAGSYWGVDSFLWCRFNITCL